MQDGNDDCGDHYVSIEQLTELYQMCCRVATSKMKNGMIENGQTLENGEWKPNLKPGQVFADEKTAQELLPTVEGFFFGSTNYDEYYMQDIEHTIEILKPIVENVVNHQASYYYSSSW